jgi:hypothetical protein
VIAAEVSDGAKTDRDASFTVPILPDRTADDLCCLETEEGEMRGSRLGVVGVLVCLLAVSGCTHGSGDGDTATTPVGGSGSPSTDTHVGFKATVQQQRLDVGTRRIGLELTSDGQTTAHVDAVQLVSAAFDQQPFTPKDTDFTPGRIIDLVVLYGDPVCTRDVDPSDAMVRVKYDVDGTADMLTLPVDKHGVGVLADLRDDFCAHVYLERAASLTYQLPFHRQDVGGSQALVGNLLLRRPSDGGSGEPVTVTGLLGSVILDLLPLRDQGAGWGRLERGQPAVEVPIQLRPGRLCTPHGRSGTQQPFIFSAYVQVGHRALHREIIEPPRRLQVQSLALLDDVCG